MWVVLIIAVLVANKAFGQKKIPNILFNCNFNLTGYAQN